MRNSFTPLLSASSCVSADKKAVKMTIVLGSNLLIFSKWRISRADVSPSMTGIEMSVSMLEIGEVFTEGSGIEMSVPITTASKLPALYLFSASRPFIAVS